MSQTSREGMEEEIALFDLVLVLLKRMRLIVRMTLAITILTIIVSLTLPEIFEGTIKIVPSQQSSSVGGMMLSQISSIAGGLGQLAGLPGGPASPSDQIADMLGCRTITDAIIDRFDLLKRYEIETYAGARKALAGVVDIKSDAKSGVITLAVQDRDPKRAADMANAFAEELTKLNNNMSNSDASRRRVFLEGQLKEAMDALSRAEDDLKDFQQTTGAIKIDNQATAIFEGIATLRAQIAAKEIQIKVMKTYATPFNRDVRQMEEEVAGLREQLKKIENGSPGYYGNTNIATDQMPALGAEYLRKARQFKFQETLYGIIKGQYESARMDEISNSSSIGIIDSAVVPDKKVKPKRALMVIAAAVISTFFGICAAFLMEYWERLRNDPRQSERLAKLDEYLAPIRNNRAIAAARRIFRRKSRKSREPE